jgi:magnesium transporter
MTEQHSPQPAVSRPSRKTGMSPGTMIHVGRRVSDEVVVEVQHYEKGKDLACATLGGPDEAQAYRGRPGVTWLDVNGIHDVPLVERIGHIFDLHPLLLEDIVNAHQRPKLEQHGEHLFLIVKMLLEHEQTHEIEMEQVSVVMGAGFVITFQERERDTFDSVRRRLADPRTRIRQQGPDFLAYALVDTIVDNYFVVLEHLGDRIEELEDRVIEDPDRDTLEEIFAVKRTLAELRRAIWPLRDALGAMGRGDTPLVQRSTLPYLRDVQDHTMRVIDTIESYREMAATMVEMYMSSVSNRLNDVMRVLTVIATVFIPLTFVVGVYGMNFTHMPELAWRWGYPVVWVVMVGITAFLLVAFRKRGWL